MNPEEELRNLIKRAERNGMLVTKPSQLTRNLSKKNGNYLVFNNRRLNKSIVIDTNNKKLRELLGA
jgi:hypothetical protein